MKILLADDDPIIRKLLSEVLSEDGHEVSSAPNGAEAVAKIPKGDFELVFLDVHMPVMNGLEALRNIRSMYPHLPVVMMDSYPDQLAKEAVNEGALTCIHKPFDLKEIREAILKIKELSKKEAQFGVA